jgi:hypothetical protein
MPSLRSLRLSCRTCAPCHSDVAQEKEELCSAAALPAAPQ